jgi:hypothetical protein
MSHHAMAPYAKADRAYHHDIDQVISKTGIVA